MISTTTKRDRSGATDLQAVIDHITDTYHGPLEAHLSRLDRLMAYVAARYGLSYFKLQPIAQLFVKLEGDLRCHVADTEERLFPRLRRLGTGEENHVETNDSFVALVREVIQNDERIARLFRQLSELTSGYDAASDACPAYQDIIQSLGTLDERTRTHLEAEEELLSRAGRFSQPGTTANKATRVEFVD